MSIDPMKSGSLTPPGGSRLDPAGSASGLSAERLQVILQRLTSGYYESAQVHDRVAHRVKDELAGPAAVA